MEDVGIERGGGGGGGGGDDEGILYSVVSIYYNIKLLYSMAFKMLVKLLAELETIN